MGKIGDLFVRLGLKKDEFDKGIKGAESSLDGFGDKAKAVGGKIKAGWAAVAAVMAGAVGKFAQEFVTKTNGLNDRWEMFTTGLKGGWDAFVRQLASGDGWDGLIANIKRSAAAAREAKASMDEMFERQASLQYFSADVAKQIAQLDLIRSDTSRSDKERAEASQKILDLLEDEAEMAVDVATQEQEARRKELRNATGLADSQIDYIVANYNKNIDVLRLAQEYNDEVGEMEAKQRKYSGFYGNAPGYLKFQEELAAFNNKYPQWIRDVATSFKNYDKANDELIMGVVNADLAVTQAQTNMYRAQRRANSTLGSLNKSSAGDTGGGGSSVADEALAEAVKVAEAAAESQKSKLQIESEGYQQSLALLAAHNLDSENLLRQHIAAIKEIVGAGKYVYQDLAPDFDWNIEGDMAGANDYLEQMSEGAIANFDAMRERGLMLSETLATGVVDGINYLSDALFGLEDFNAASLLSALLTPLADMAQKEGAILIASGMGIEAIKKSLASLNGAAAIAAGVTLVAAASAVKSGLSALANSSSAGTSTSYGGSSSSNAQTIESEMTIYVTGRLSGQDILLSGQKTASNWAR